MNTPFFIAKRYFYHDSLLKALLALWVAVFTLQLKTIGKRWRDLGRQIKRSNFIQWLSGLAMIGLCLGTAALVVILSVFNGLEGLTRQLFKNYNPEIKVSPITGKVATISSQQYGQLTQLEGIVAVSRVIEDQALLRYDTRQKVVYLKGVDDQYFNVTSLDTCVKAGTAQLWRNGYPQALLGVGVQYELSVNVRSDFQPIQFWYPKRQMKMTLQPEKAFEKKSVLPAGSFIVDPEFDARYVLVPYSFAAELMQRDTTQVSHLAIRTTGKANYAALKKGIAAIIGPEFQVQTLEEQQAGILKAIQVEKLFVSIAMVFILGIVAFNVFYSLAMLTIEKKRDIAVLRALGGSDRFVRNVFLLEGSLIGAQGTILGLVLGFLVCFLQQTFGFVKLGGRSTIVDSYPVVINALDFLFAGVSAVVVTLLASVPPARKAARTEILSDLG